jgi:ketosteroid isomerase-like protein
MPRRTRGSATTKFGHFKEAPAQRNVTLTVVAIAVTCLGAFVTAASAQQSTAEQQLIQLERDWCTAQLKRDAALLGRILADDYTGVSSRGVSESKAQALASLNDRTNAFTFCNDDNFKVRIYGDVAVVTARASRSGTFNGVAYKDRRTMYTDVFVRKDGRWQCVASHNTLVAPQQT